MPLTSSSATAPRSAPTPSETLTWSAIAALLALPAGPDRDLARAQVFDGPGGLACRLTPAHAGGSVALRPSICIGLHVDDIPAGAVGALLAMQSTLLASGRWFLGMDDTGTLALTALVTASSAADVAACFCEGHLAAWTTLSALLQPEAAVDSQRRDPVEVAAP